MLAHFLPLLFANSLLVFSETLISDMCHPLPGSVFASFVLIFLFDLCLNSKSVYFSVSEDTFDDLSACPSQSWDVLHHSDGEVSPNER